MALREQLKEFFINVLKFKNVTLFDNIQNTVDRNILIMGTKNPDHYNTSIDNPAQFKVSEMETFLKGLTLMTKPHPLPKIQFMDDSYVNYNYMKTNPELGKYVVSVHITPHGNVDMTFDVANKFVSSQLSWKVKFTKPQTGHPIEYSVQYDEKEKHLTVYTDKNIPTTDLDDSGFIDIIKPPLYPISKTIKQITISTPNHITIFERRAPAFNAKKKRAVKSKSRRKSRSPRRRV